MYTKRFLIFAVFIGLSAQLFGQINPRQKKQDRDQLEQGKEGMARDQEEIQAFQQSVAEFQGAQQSGDKEKLQETYQGLDAVLRDVRQPRHVLLTTGVRFSFGEDLLESNTFSGGLKPIN